jgi:hypothetical protein
VATAPAAPPAAGLRLLRPCLCRRSFFFSLLSFFLSLWRWRWRCLRRLRLREEEEEEEVDEEEEEDPLRRRCLRLRLRLRDDDEAEDGLRLCRRWPCRRCLRPRLELRLRLRLRLLLLPGDCFPSAFLSREGERARERDRARGSPSPLAGTEAASPAGMWSAMRARPAPLVWSRRKGCVITGRKQKLPHFPLLCLARPISPSPHTFQPRFRICFPPASYLARAFVPRCRQTRQRGSETPSDPHAFTSLKRFGSAPRKHAAPCVRGGRLHGRGGPLVQ